MKKLINDLRTAWAFWKWHRTNRPQLSRGKVMGDAVCMTDLRFLHPAYTPSELERESMRVAAEHLVRELLLRPYKIDWLEFKDPGHNNRHVRLMATPVQQSYAANNP